MDKIDGFIDKLTTYIITPILTFFFTLSVLLFLFGVVKFIFNRTKGKSEDDGKQHMLYGIIGMAIMVSAWAIVRVIWHTLY